MKPAALVVFLKELKDARRDRRTWTMVLLSSVVTGPLALLLVATLVSGMEESAAKREVFVSGPTNGPTLVNFLRRAGANIKEPPTQYRDQIKSGELANAVIIIPPDFESRYASGRNARVEVMYDETASKAQAAVRTTLRLLSAFNREAGQQRLFARGVSPGLLAAVEVDEINLASSQARGAQLLFLVPWLALLGAVVGAVSVAIDVTGGERERGSLEPLLMHPINASAIVIGKWAVVACCSGAVVVLTLFGFLGAMQLIRNETLAALMQFGGTQLALFLVMLLPFSALVAAINMLAAVYGRSYKEAQTYVSYITIVINFVPILPMFLSIRDAAWQLLVPGMGQMMVLMRSLRGDSVTLLDVAAPGLVALGLAAFCLVLQSRLLTHERIVFSRS